jgi:hypothetical protein
MYDLNNVYSLTDRLLLIIFGVFLGAYAELRKTTLSFVMSVRLSVCRSARPIIRVEQLGSHCTDYREI